MEISYALTVLILLKKDFVTTTADFENICKKLKLLFFIFRV